MPLATFLNAGTADQLHGLPWLALSETGMVMAGSFVSDGGGAATQTWGTAVPNVPCRIDPLGSDQRGILAERIDERSTHLVTVPAGTPVTTENQFAIAGRGSFEITATRDHTGEMVRNFEVLKIS